MASPAAPLHPLTPPAEPPTQTQNASQPPQPSNTTRTDTLLAQPLTSLTDDGSSHRPRDHRLMHLLLSAYGVTAYQERVPLQLLDFAYRYSSSILADALHVQSEGYDQAEATAPAKSRGKGQNKNEDGEITLASLRVAIGMRTNHQFQSSLPKEFLKQLADDRNRISLNAGMREGDEAGPVVGGVRLPHERYCLTGMSWGLKDEWESEGEESMEGDEHTSLPNQNGTNPDAMQVDGVPQENGEDENEDEDEEGLGNMDDIFGPDHEDPGAGDEEMKDD